MEKHGHLKTRNEKVLGSNTQILFEAYLTANTHSVHYQDRRVSVM